MRVVVGIDAGYLQTGLPEVGFFLGVSASIDQNRAMVMIERTSVHEVLFKEKTELAMRNGGVIRDTVDG